MLLPFVILKPHDMKHLSTPFALGLLLSTMAPFSADLHGQAIPDVQIKDLESRAVSTAQYITEAQGPVLICFWATWCSPCKRELNAYADYYREWQDLFGLELIAVSIDDPRSVSRVKPYVNAAGWDYSIWLDPNGEFKRAMQVINAPHTFLVDPATNEVIWQHNSYTDGDEDEVYEQLEILAGKHD